MAKATTQATPHPPKASGTPSKSVSRTLKALWKRSKTSMSLKEWVRQSYKGDEAQTWKTNKST